MNGHVGSSEGRECGGAHCLPDFQLSNFLSEDARQSWSKIMAKQISSSLWKELRGVVHNSPRSKTWDSFQECVTFHMLMMFRNDAAEAQRYYISNRLKKPNRDPIGQFVQHVQQLNDYLELLPICTRAIKP